MRLSVAGYSNFAFLLFLRLALVTALCLTGPVLISKVWGPRVAEFTLLAAFPLWWWHFGLPRFKEHRSGFFSPGFCLVGYLVMTASLVLITLMTFGILKEGQSPQLPHWFPRSRVARFLILLAIFYLFAFLKQKLRKKDSKTLPDK